MAILPPVLDLVLDLDFNLRRRPLECGLTGNLLTEQVLDLKSGTLYGNGHWEVRVDGLQSIFKAFRDALVHVSKMSGPGSSERLLLSSRQVTEDLEVSIVHRDGDARV